jgi:hypothetical protein
MTIFRSKYDREDLIRSLRAGRGEKVASGERIWGCSEFVWRVLDEVSEQEKETS